MPTVGTGQLARLELPVYDNTTAAELHLLSPPDADGVRTTSTVAVTSPDGGHTWVGDVPPYPAAGLWNHIWTVTGTGAGRTTFQVSVDPDLTTSALRSYATTTQLVNWMRQSLPEDAERMLAAATREVDTLLLTAVYPIDAQEMPTDPVHRQAMADAACELVSWWLDTGDESGAAALYGSLSAGSISVGRLANNAVAVDRRIPQTVRDILRQAGLFNRRPSLR